MNPVVVRMFTQANREPREAGGESAAAVDKPCFAVPPIVPPSPTVAESERAVRSPGQVGHWKLGRKRSEHEDVAVYEAWNDQSSGDRAPYIVKLLRRDASEAALQALKREAAAAGDVNDSHVVWIAASQLHEPPYYTVMPRLHGKPLAKFFENGTRRFSPATALWFARQTAEGLAALHAHAWLHGDVKPENLLVSPQGHVTLLDLGCARRLDDPASEIVPYLAGTIDYLAPEALCSRLRIDIRSDLYSLGLVLYELLVGRRSPPAKSPAELIERRLTQPPLAPRAENADVPLEVSELVTSLTAHEPLRRPQSAAELAGRLAELEIAFLDRR
jgi:serine/threonine-protein kinase